MKKKILAILISTIIACSSCAGCSIEMIPTVPETNHHEAAKITSEAQYQPSAEETETVGSDASEAEYPEEYRELFNGETVPIGEDGYFFHPELEDIQYDRESNKIYFDNILIVYLTDVLDEYGRVQIAESIGGELAGSVSGALNMIQVKLPPTNLQGLEEAAVLAMLQDRVYYACTDIPVEPEASASEEWGGEQEKGNIDDPNGNDWWAEAIDAYTAWNAAEGCERITVGIIDDGFYENHEELKDHIQVLTDLKRKEHGTHVAGLIAASNNQVGIRGVSDGSPLICYGTDRDGAAAVSIAEQMAQVAVLVKRGAKVINISRGTILKSKFMYSSKDANDFFLYFWRAQDYDEYVKAHHQACIEEGKHGIAVMLGLHYSGYDNYMIVQSAGNGYDNGGKEGYDSFDSGYFNTINAFTYNLYIESIMYGAEVFSKGLSESSGEALTAKAKEIIRDIKELGEAYFTDRILRVGSVRNEHPDGIYRMATDSNYNVDICAPGYEVYSSVYVSINGTSKYKNKSGTSMASPITAGSAALLWAIDPTLSPGETKQLLLESAQMNAMDEDTGYLYPMLNVGAAARKLKEKEISPYITHPQDLPSDWSLDQGEGLPNLSFPRIYREPGFTYGESDKRVMKDGPGFLFVADKTGFVTLYGVSAADPVDTLKTALIENGWYNDSGSYTVQQVTGPKGENLTVTEERYHMTGVDLYDMSLLVYYTPEGKILYWIMTNEGMATMDNAVEYYLLGYRFPQ